MEELIAKYATLPPRQRYGAFAMLVVIVLLGHWYFVYSGQSDRLDGLEKKYQDLEAKRAIERRRPNLPF